MSRLPIDESSTEESQIKEVFAQFGAATFQAQVLEQGLATYLTIRKLQWPWSPDEFDATRAAVAKSTLGKMVRELRTYLPHETALHNELQKVVAFRNQLAHRYFWDNAYAFYRPKGRLDMAASLAEIQEAFQTATTKIDHLTEETYADLIPNFTSRVEQAYRESISKAILTFP